jgi:peptidyl-prolyl cis-trans isomerase C
MRYNKIKMVIISMNISKEEVTMQSIVSRKIEVNLAFTLMKFAVQIFGKTIAELTTDEYAEAYQQACHDMILHEKVLLSEPACGVIIPNSVLQTTFETIQEEYGGKENFFHHLQKSNLQENEYLSALHNDLLVAATLTRVAFHAGPVSHQELQDYYNSHQDSFCLPEQRSTRHILISTENTYSHLPKDVLLRRITCLHDRLQRDPQRFSQEAHLHSDCTTAMDGGDLGRVSRGELCAVLDHALFLLGAGEISPIIQTKQGFHILLCETIHPGQRLKIEEVYQQIHQILTKEKRITACRTWLKSLFPNLK